MSTVLKPQMAQDADPDQYDHGATSRQMRSERIMTSEGVPFEPDQPLIRFPGDTRARCKTETAYRALCVLVTAMRAERMDQTMPLRVIREYGLAAYLSPREKNFIRSAAPAEAEITAFLWTYEAAWVLLWGLGYIDCLAIPNRTCEVNRAVDCMRSHNTRSFINQAKPRPLTQLLDQADLTHRYYASVSDSGQVQRMRRPRLQVNIVEQRRSALNWLIRYPCAEWDDIDSEN